MLTTVRDLFPICRSITGAGLRQTLAYVAGRIPLRLTEVASGTPILDWTVPDEWTIRGATIETLAGERLVDFAECNLHVVGYSRGVDAVVSREELARHVHTLPGQPNLVPYRTGYFANDWGFCLAHRVWAGMTDPAYRVRIDSDLAPGSLTYGECHLPGETDQDIFLSVHCCHPSLANDNLSSLAVALELIQRLAKAPRRRGLRIVFAPGTVGAIAWLALNEQAALRISDGLVLSCLGDAGDFTYKRSRRETARIDRVVARVAADAGLPLRQRPFSPFGYDERQYCSPGYDLPVGCLMRSPAGGFPEYHTSADDLGFVTASNLAGSLDFLTDVMAALDADVRLARIDGRGEPQLGRRNLYAATGGKSHEDGDRHSAMLWLLNLADGQHDLVDIAERSGLTLRALRTAADVALAANLVREILPPTPHEDTRPCRE